VHLVWFPRFSPDSKLLITAHGSWDAQEGGEVRVWETETGKPKFTIPTARGVRTVAWAPKEGFFVSGDYGGKVLFYDSQTGERTGEIQLPGNVEVLQIAPDEKRLYAASGDGSVRVFELPSRKEVHTWKGLHQGGIWGLALSPDGATLCTGGQDDFAHLLDVETFAVLHDFQHPADVNGVVFTDDNQHVLTGCGDGAIRVFEVESGNEVRRLMGHTRGSVTDLCFAPGGKLLASSAMDGTVRLWDTADFATAKLTATLDGLGDLVFGVAISPDGKWLASGDWNDHVKVFELATKREKWSWQR
jgi:WD40 repeat protein